MANIPSARVSPRVENGVVYWYAGNTFDWILELDLEDQDGEPINIAAGATVKVTFKNSKQNTVKEFTFNNISNNTVTMDFDSACSGLFPIGNYTYDLLYTSVEKTTLIKDNRVVVQ